MKERLLPEPVEALILVLLVFFGILFFTLSAAQLFIGDKPLAEVESQLTLFFLFGEILFIIVPLVYSYKKNYSIKTLFRFNPVSLDTVIFTIILGLSLVILIDEIERLIVLLVPIPESLQGLIEDLNLTSTQDWVLFFLGSVIFAAVAEEGLFRGFLQVTLESKGDPTRAVVLTSVCWALIHINPVWAIPIFILGVFLGYVAWKTQSVWPAIIIHSLNNFIAILFLSDEFNAHMGWYTMGDHVSPVILITAMGGVYYSIKMIGRQ
jgi:membrane protease YdiL (CAAX protease family)